MNQNEEYNDKIDQETQENIASPLIERAARHFLDIKTIRRQNQGEGGVNPETGDPRFNPYLIPPDRQICKEYSVRNLVPSIFSLSSSI